MARGDSPPFTMRVSNLHLVPMTQWDQERLASYRNGAEVSVVVTQEVASWRRKKYWAILSLVMKTCGLPAKAGSTTDSLHDAICREAGYVDSYTSNGTTLTIKRQKTSKFDDQKFEAFFRDAMEVLQDWTGIDPETLNKESSDVGPETNSQMSSALAPDPAEEAGSDTRTPGPPATQGVAPDQSQTPSPTSSQANGAGLAADLLPGGEPDRSVAADLPEGGDATGSAHSPPSKPDTSGQKAECIRQLLEVATSTVAGSQKARQQMLVELKDDWKRWLPDDLTFVKTAVDTANNVIKGTVGAERAREYLGGLVR